jgi:steroid 5-alpha reductase family enzyme
MVLGDILPMFVAALVGALCLQLLAYTQYLRYNRVDVVDVAWGMTFVAAVVTMQLYMPTVAPAVLLVDGLILVWAARLSLHIYQRFVRTSRQDERYTALIARWPRRHTRLQVLTRIFMVQALLAVMVSAPVAIIHHYQPSFTTLVWCGLVLWMVGFVIEALADRQLAVFLRTSKPGSLMQLGLWRYSRHPNYFGEITMWWGIAVMAATTPLWPVGFLGAATITILICYVSGIPLAEQRASGKPGWQRYRQSTSVLLPWPPRSR